MTFVRSKLARWCLLFNLVALALNLSLFVLRFDISPVSEFFAGEAVSRGERQLMMGTFAALVETLDAANITYFMYGGTLIGSLRHHGMIPWDDDIDVIIAAANRSTARTTLGKMSPHYELYTPDEGRKTMMQWKFYASSAGRTSWMPKQFRWPYVDIFFFGENATHVWDLDSDSHAAGFVWPKSSVFPLTRRPFGEFMVPAPCDAVSFVSANYAGAESTACTSPSYNHRTEVTIWRSARTLPCSRLWHVFPFVFRTRSADGKTVETLKIGNWILQSHVVSANVCSLWRVKNEPQFLAAPFIILFAYCRVKVLKHSALRMVILVDCMQYTPEWDDPDIFFFDLSKAIRRSVMRHYSFLRMYVFNWLMAFRQRTLLLNVHYFRSSCIFNSGEYRRLFEPNICRWHSFFVLFFSSVSCNANTCRPIWWWCAVCSQMMKKLHILCSLLILS